ncbi:MULTISPECIES: cytochrome c oxidase subunit 4 [unclassified Streptomyces]|uniref:aa3-type cytochrome oxidase subunit IV n=1 Tax=unclassified Streptomyces TaxID=2593676 RepID=UPI002740514A|nr:MULTISPECIES: cytochrome c oxidase subunit 4 [unclassified Streptomyces]
MRTEVRLFTGVALFFAVTAADYGRWSAEPAGTAALALAAVMAALVAFFLRVRHRRDGPRAEDRPDAEVIDAAGPVGFFSPHSPWPVVVALGTAVLALGVVYGLWLALLGFGVLGCGVLGMVFQYPDPEPDPRL